MNRNLIPGAVLNPNDGVNVVISQTGTGEPRIFRFPESKRSEKLTEIPLIPFYSKFCAHQFKFILICVDKRSSGPEQLVFDGKVFKRAQTCKCFNCQIIPFRSNLGESSHNVNHGHYHIDDKDRPLICVMANFESEYVGDIGCPGKLEFFLDEQGNVGKYIFDIPTQRWKLQEHLKDIKFLPAASTGTKITAALPPRQPTLFPHHIRTCKHLDNRTIYFATQEHDEVPEQYVFNPIDSCFERIKCSKCTFDIRLCSEFRNTLDRKIETVSSAGGGHKFATFISQGRLKWTCTQSVSLDYKKDVFAYQKEIMEGALPAPKALEPVYSPDLDPELVFLGLETIGALEIWWYCDFEDNKKAYKYDVEDPTLMLEVSEDELKAARQKQLEAVVRGEVNLDDYVDSDEEDGPWGSNQRAISFMRPKFEEEPITLKEFLDSSTCDRMPEPMFERSKNLDEFQHALNVLATPTSEEMQLRQMANKPKMSKLRMSLMEFDKEHAFQQRIGGMQSTGKPWRDFESSAKQHVVTARERDYLLNLKAEMRKQEDLLRDRQLSGMEGYSRFLDEDYRMRLRCTIEGLLDGGGPTLEQLKMRETRKEMKKKEKQEKREKKEKMKNLLREEKSREKKSPAAASASQKTDSITEPMESGESDIDHSEYHNVELEEIPDIRV